MSLFVLRLLCKSVTNIFFLFINRRFDESLRSQNPNWGIRNLEDVIQLAESQGLEFIESIEMPANNLSVIFRKK